MVLQDNMVIRQARQATGAESECAPNNLCAWDSNAGVVLHRRNMVPGSRPAHTYPLGDATVSRFDLVDACIFRQPQHLRSGAIPESLTMGANLLVAELHLIKAGIGRERLIHSPKNASSQGTCNALHFFNARICCQAVSKRALPRSRRNRARNFFDVPRGLCRAHVDGAWAYGDSINTGIFPTTLDCRSSTPLRAISLLAAGKAILSIDFDNMLVVHDPALDYFRL